MSRDLPIYLDNAATTPVDPQVVAVMNDCLSDPALQGNPAAAHGYAERAEMAIEKAREQVAALINGDPDGVLWTSGATESDNLALLGGARFRSMMGHHIVSSATEHSAVLGPLKQLKEEGFQVTLLEPDSQGRITADQVRDALTDDTILVSIMHANNETGVIQDVGSIGEVCRSCDVLFHVDAAQSAGRLPLDVEAQNIDLLSLSAHKLYGPKGVGGLYLNRDRISRLEPLAYGGSHERGLRPGTLATHQIVGMGAAFALAAERFGEDAQKIGALRESLWDAISAADSSDELSGGLIRNSADADTLYSILSVSVPGVEGESLLLAISDIAVASGSACLSDTDEPSYVMRSLGHDDQLAQSTIRFSLGRFNTQADVDDAANRFAEAVRALRQLAGEG